MAILDTSTIETINEADLEQIPSKLLRRSFGSGNDTIELKIFDKNGKLLIKDERFKDYKSYQDEGGTREKPKTTSIDIDYEQVTRDYGFNNGTYILSFSFQRQVTNVSKPFAISEISPSRKEIRVLPNNISQADFKLNILSLSNAIISSAFIKDINLSFNQVSSLVVNAKLDRDGTGLIKLYDPLPFSVRNGSNFKVYEEIINPLEVTVQLTGTDDTIDVGIDIGPANFSLTNENIFSVPSGYKTFDQILNSGAATSSFNQVQSFISSSGVYLDLEFDNVDTPSGYHFENFTHFSSATERLKNFRYKLGLLESYSSSLAQLNNITGDITASNFVIENKTIFESKQDRLIQGFDLYEQYLYYESGAYSWPKTNSTKPFINAKIDSAAANSWFGVLVDSNLETYNGGQMYSASRYDECNVYNLVNTIPPHIKDNPQNDKYVLFTEMIGQHFDGIWAYIDSITDINEAYSGLKDGISKDLVLNQLTSRGISAYDQFSNASLYEYLIGDDGTGTFQFGTNDTATMISASNGGSIPKGDIAKEIWKRLYHNSSYLLKTKGTERGLKALIACYGIPESVLHVKEYGGPLVDKTGFRTFSYQKESRMAKLSNSVGNIVTDAGDPKFTNTKTLQVRFLPETNYFEPQDIIHCRENLLTPDQSIAIGISQSIDHTKFNSASFAHLVIATGSTGNIGKAASLLGPIYNGDVWNLSVNITSGSDGTGNNLTAFLTNTTPNKNTYVLSCSLDLPNNYYAEGTGRTIRVAPSNLNSGAPPDYPLMGQFSGSVQEYRRWGEGLTKSTIVSQSLSPFNYNGNTISSSFESLLVRASLGSNNQNLPTTTVTNLNFAPKEENRTNNTISVHGDSMESTFLEETHHLTTPDTVGSAMVSDKVRIDNGTFDDNFLDPFISVETSPQDRQPLDYSDLGIFFSPTFEVNEDIIYTLGGFRLDDYIGDPKHYTSGSYPDLKTIRDIYFQKSRERLKFGDYIRTIQFFDHTLFKLIKEFVPAKANLKTGLVIEPHYLERTKIAGTNVDYEQKTEHLASYSPSGSISAETSARARLGAGQPQSATKYNTIINVTDYILSGSNITATENVAQQNKISKRFFF
jgi:hypothetical protein